MHKNPFNHDKKLPASVDETNIYQFFEPWHIRNFYKEGISTHSILKFSALRLHTIIKTWIKHRILQTSTHRVARICVPLPSSFLYKSLHNIVGKLINKIHTFPSSIKTASLRFSYEYSGPIKNLIGCTQNLNKLCLYWIIIVEVFFTHEHQTINSCKFKHDLTWSYYY